MWRATCRKVSRQACAKDFNPRPPWGGRRPQALVEYNEHGISIHALRGEGDVELFNVNAERGHFNPRPPWGGRRQACRQQSWLQLFQSTPSVGRATRRSLTSKQSSLKFNPRPPWGGRLPTVCVLVSCVFISIHALRGEGDIDRFLKLIDVNIFQSTPSVGRATYSLLSVLVTFSGISIHALRGEGDMC